MNNKHLACTVLGMIIAAVAYCTLSMKNKLSTMNEEATAAEEKANSAAHGKMIEQAKLAKKSTSTKDTRDYLAEWEKWLESTEDAGSAERVMRFKLKQGDLVALSRSMSLVNYKKGSAIPRLLRAKLDFEDDYRESLTWLGTLESSLPTSRTSQFRLSKGQSGDDIRMELSVDLPLGVTKKDSKS